MEVGKKGKEKEHEKREIRRKRGRKIPSIQIQSRYGRLLVIVIFLLHFVNTIVCFFRILHFYVVLFLQKQIGDVIYPIFRRVVHEDIT